MELNIEGQGGGGYLKLPGDELLKFPWRIQVQVMLPVHQAHAGDQTNKSEIVITMQMRNKNMIDAAATNLVSGQLHLGTLPAIHQEQVVIQRDHLRSRVTIISGKGRVISKDSNSQQKFQNKGSQFKA